MTTPNTQSSECSACGKQIYQRGQTYTPGDECICTNTQSNMKEKHTTSCSLQHIPLDLASCTCGIIRQDNKVFNNGTMVREYRKKLTPNTQSSEVEAWKEQVRDWWYSIQDLLAEKDLSLPERKRVEIETIIKNITAPKVNRSNEVEEIVEEFKKMMTGRYYYAHDGTKQQAQDWLRTTLTQYHQDLMSEVKKEREACAVTVWNYLATFEDCLEPTQRTNALIHAIHLIRKRSNQALTEAQTIIKSK